MASGEYTFEQSRWGVFIPSLIFCLIAVAQVYGFFLLEDLEFVYRVAILLVGPFLFMVFATAGLSGLLSLARGSVNLRVDAEGFQDDTLVRRRGWKITWDMVESLDFQPEYVLVTLKNPVTAVSSLPFWQRWWLGYVLEESGTFQLDTNFLKAEFGDLVWALRQNWRAYQKSLPQDEL